MRIGSDLGGSKIEVVLRRRVATPAGDCEGTIAAVVEPKPGRRCTVGIGMPGALSPATELVTNASSTGLNGRPFDRDVMAALARPVRFANDANCFALSGAIDGAAAGAAVVFGVILGTGVSGRVVVDRRLLVGPNAIAGEWGHSPLPWPGDDERPGLEPAAIADRAAAGDAAAETSLACDEDRLARGDTSGGRGAAWLWRLGEEP